MIDYDQLFWHELSSYEKDCTGIDHKIKLIVFYKASKEIRHHDHNWANVRNALENKPYLLVSNKEGNFNFKDNFTVSVSENPQILNWDNMKLSMQKVEYLIDWVKFNCEVLQNIWNWEMK